MSVSMGSISASWQCLYLGTNRDRSKNTVDDFYTSKSRIRRIDCFLRKPAFQACLNLWDTTWLTISAESRPVILKRPSIIADTRECISGLKVNDPRASYLLFSTNGQTVAIYAMGSRTRYIPLTVVQSAPKGVSRSTCAGQDGMCVELNSRSPNRCVHFLDGSKAVRVLNLRYISRPGCHGRVLRCRSTNSLFYRRLK